jgi:diacylglycerol kinase (ATP)
MQPKHVIIAYNPKSGSFDPALLDRLRGAFVDAGRSCHHVDSYGDDLTDLAAMAEHICVVGGDGTLRDVAARLHGMAGVPPISIYPAGTINLVARELEYPRNVQKFVARVLNGGAARPLYLGLLNQQPLLVCASIGPESFAVAAVSEPLKTRIGRFAYVAALCKILLHWPRPALTVRADGADYQCEAVYVLNGRYFAGAWRLSLAADMTVPTFQLLMLPRARRRDYVRLIFSVVLIPALASKRWVRLTASSVDVTADTALPIQVDGDIAATLPLAATAGKHAMLFA